jgi:hypothetical protein
VSAGRQIGVAGDDGAATHRRLAQLALAVVFLITAKLIDWRNRWSLTTSPIR